LERLAGENAGLCLVTTRQKVIELEGYGSTVDRIELGDLSDAAGSELLRALGVKGSDEELLGAVNGSHGNALALNLLGAFLKDHYDGAVRPWRAIDPIGTDLQEGEHARRVVEASTSQLGEGPAIDVLRLLGLFPGKAEPAQVECLLREPPIQGLTDRILPFNRETWNSTVARLRRLELLTPANGDSKALDAHPLVRAYFTSQIRLKFRESCSEGHHRLFEHCMGDPTKPPKEKAEMEPLFEAMFHGCRAGEHETAYRKVLLPQILQWKEKEHSRFFSTNTLGLWSQTLEAIGLLFKDPWIAVRDEFSGHDAAFLFTSAGACLRALYRFREAVEATGRGLKLRLQAGEWSEAALAERMLNQMHIAAGQLREAQDFGRRSVEHALQGANTNDRAYARARCAESLHHGGKVKEALALFQEALGEGDPLPDGFSEFEYCDLLMTLGRDNEAAARADAVIEREAGQKPRQPLWRGLGHLVLGRIDFSRGLGKPKSSSERTALLGNARDHLDRALEGLQAADEQQHLPLGYLARAMLNCAEYRPKEAEEDLAKVRRVAEPSGMLLHLTDYYLVSAVCGLEWGRLSVVAEHLEKARSLIEKTGYDRRGKELKELEDRTARKDGLGKR
jgi:tetratricopeptide (TPR) repeat protein